MTLIAPILDNRTYAQIKDDLVKRIPVYAPEWTDHNESDPGIALLELFAHLGESLLFNFNQIPDATRVAFLRLLGLQPRSAQSAHALLALQTERPHGVQVLRGVEATAGDISFETEDEVYAWPLEALTAAKQLLPDPDAADQAEKRRRQHAAGGVAQAAAANFYEVVTLPDDPTQADATIIDVGATPDQSLWVALLDTPTADLAALRGRTLFVGVAFDEDIDRPFDLEALKNRPSRLEEASELISAPPQVRWELWQPDDARQPLLPLDRLGDTTRGMTTTGVVKLALPESFPVQQRGAVTQGDRTSPPPLEDAGQTARVVGWLRVTRPDDENDPIHRIRWVGLNAVSVIQQRMASAELLGLGTGEPDQTVALTKQPVVRGTVELDVEEAAGWRAWTEVETFASSGADDRHFLVDPSAGTVQFGPRSQAPQLGGRIRARSYRYGGGAGGNVAAGAISALAGVASAKVRNVLPAVGGTDPASLTEAAEELPSRLHRRDRAVVAEDFTELASEVSGVARAEALPLFHPDTPRIDAAGVVSVVVFPEEDVRNPGAPQPDLGLLRRVGSYLQPRRLVTTELYVIPPTYGEIAVSVGVEVKPGYQVDAIRRWVELIVRQYLSPLPPYGPDGRGWPLGRTVRRAELEAVCTQVDGVDSIVGRLKLAWIERPVAPAGGPTPLAIVHKSKEVAFEKWQVPELATVTVVSGSALPVTADPTTGTPTGPVLVPLPPEVC